MLEFSIAAVILLELAAFFAICLLLYPLHRFPGVRVYYWLGAITGGVWIAELCQLTGLILPVQPVKIGLFLLVWMVLPVIGCAFVLDLQGSGLVFSPTQHWSTRLALFGVSILVISTGILFPGSGLWSLLVWAFGSGVLVYSITRFLSGYRQAVSRFQVLIMAIAALLVLSGLLGIWGLWSLPWNGITLVLAGLVMLAAGTLFLKQQAILRRLGENQRRETIEAGENWFLLDPAGRILDFDGQALRLLKQLHQSMIGLKIHQLLPNIGKVLEEIETHQRLDVDMADDFFGTTRMCRFSMFFPLHIRTIFEPRVLRIRALPSLGFEPQGQNPAEDAHADLLRQKMLMQTALDAFNQGIMITDSEGKVTYRNQVLIELLDLSDQTLLIDDSEWKEKISRQMKDPERLIKFVGQILSQAMGETLDILECSDGRLLECRTRFYFVDSLGAGFRLWGFSDCTEQQRRERELQHMGMHDTLTGIYNRAFFEMKLRQLRLVSLYPVCMFMVDVDGLKHVNDYQGHTTGDQVLRQAAYVLRQACRTEDIVARLGGDEFGLLLVHADIVIAEQIATRIHGLLNMYNIRHSDIPVSISMGYAIAENPKEMETLFPRADDAMYEARRKHRTGQSLMPM